MHCFCSHRSSILKILEPSFLNHAIVACLFTLFNAVQGYGTVRFSSPEEAQAALQAFNGRDCEGRSLFVFFDKYA